MNWSVPEDWPDSTAFILGGGPSLTYEDVGMVKATVAAKAVWGERGIFTLAIKDAVRLAPWADVLYGCEHNWWNHYHGAPLFEGRYRVALTPVEGAERFRNDVEPMVHQLGHFGPIGFSDDPTKLALGYNSGYQAVNLAFLFGARRVILLGFDMQPKPDAPAQNHWFGKHPWHSDDYRLPFNLFLAAFYQLVPIADRIGLRIINASRVTAMHAFPELPLPEAIGQCLPQPSSASSE